MHYQHGVRVPVSDRISSDHRLCGSEIRTFDIECAFNRTAEPMSLPFAVLIQATQTRNGLAGIGSSRDADLQSVWKAQQRRDAHGARKVFVCPVHFLIGRDLPFATGVSARI